MASLQWGDGGPDIHWSPLATTPDGGSCNIVFDIACIDHQTRICVGVLFPCLSTIRVKGLPELEPTTRSVTVIGAVCRKVGLVLLFEASPTSVVMQHSTTDSKDFRSMVELCSGIGVATWGFKACNVEVAIAVEKQECFAEKYLEQHPTTTMVCGDITMDDTIAEVCALADSPGTLFAGFNCKPYSRGGSQQGALDDRSNSLHAALNLAYLLRTPVVILECVGEAASNRHVNKELDAFCEQCKYTRSDMMMKLEDLWPCKRERWWVILSASTLGKVPVIPMQTRFFPKMVKQIFPHDLQLEENDLSELILSPEEHRRFLQYQDPLSQMQLNRNGLCPTLLHSLGSQATACPCGCRAQGFSDKTLGLKGIFGILMPAPGHTLIEGVLHSNVRHPHPTELCVLSAIPVPCHWSRPLRLWLAGIGQQANPTQALCAMSLVFRHLEVVFQGHATISPAKLLDQYLDRILLQVRAINEANKQRIHRVLPSPSSFVQDMDVELDAAETPCLPVTSVVSQSKKHIGDEMSFTVFSKGQVSPCLVKLSSPDLTIGHLKAAEVGMIPTIGPLEILDAVTGLELQNHTLLAGKCLMVDSLRTLPIASSASSPPASVSESVVPPEVWEDIPATVPFTVHDHDDVSHLSCSASDVDMVGPVSTPQASSHVEPLAALKTDEFLKMRPPIVASLQHVESMIRPTIPVDHRLQILEAQGDLWADDEIRWHLGDLKNKTGNAACTVLDPLISTSVVQTGNPALIYQWHRTLASNPKCIVTVVWSDNHWIPQVWTWKGDSLVAHSWDAYGAQQRCNVLHDAIAKAVGMRTFITHVSHRSFALSSHCGICSIRFLHHFLLGRMLPTEQSDVEHLQGVAKEMFVNALTESSSTSRPWLWAHGLDPSVHTRLLDLLVQHGVPVELAEARSAVLTTAVGFSAVQKAMVGTAPWRSLKAIANQVRPPVQLVLPDELAAAVRSKVENGQSKPKQVKGKTKPGVPQPPVALDPAKLKFDEGTFVNADGLPVPMVAVSLLGPAATGVAIATPAEVSQFLKVGSVVSAMPLAVFVINCTEAQLQTKLTWAQTRVPARCVANQEPLLLSGFLIQLGGSIVSPASHATSQVIDSAGAACIKVMVYRDACSISWSDFAKAPVKYILQCLIPLQTCDQRSPECHCEKYHQEDKSPIRDPVFDVWRRQWLSLSFRPVAQSSADVFAVNIRYLKQLEQVLLSMSGSSGVFLEPRSVDGRTSCNAYQVVWMPKSSLAELQHLRQTMPQLIGVVRMGSRLGVRTAAINAVAVNQALRPDTVILHAGPRQEYEVGPIPFGMDRAAVIALFESWNWKAKPVNPSRSIPGALGMMWLVVAVVEPTSSVFSTKTGDIVVTKVTSRAMPVEQPSPVVASSATLKLCEASVAEVSTDPFVRHDPWDTPMAKMFLKNPVVADPAIALQQVEARIEKSVLSKLPKQSEAMEVDEDAHATSRLQTLEAQVQKLSQGQSVLEQRMDESQRRTDAQFAQVHHQVSAQIESQGAHIEELFKGQLAQIESLLGKRSRHE